ncbi:MAG: zinc-binding dehydrogenase [Deltaproteobacteria bacterium]|nr:zinc-binding dehydrogenase [Deltaproteobacteria bacterium]
MKRQSLFFTRPNQVEILEETIPKPSKGKVLVRTLASAISAGSERLVYRGEFPAHTALDAAIPALNGTFAYPVKYGYSTVGDILAIGTGVDDLWQGREVFSFQPHQSHFLAETSELFPLPPHMNIRDALFLPSMETAATLVMDGAPLLGERVVIFGQGIIGLLVTTLLKRLSLEKILTLENSPRRRNMSQELGADLTIDPKGWEAEAILSLLKGNSEYEGADLTYELSGDPNALDLAVLLTGYHGRIVVGSWYGTKAVTANLGDHFHRSRIRMISSQVSTIDPALRGRWTKDRMIRLVWRLLDEIAPSRFISHTFAFEEASKAFELLDKDVDSCLQVILTYENHTR